MQEHIGQKEIGFKIKDYFNILIDNKEMFNIKTNNIIYPCIKQIENGKLKKHEFQSPENSTSFK